MLKFVSSYLALSYLAFAALMLMGLFQVLAAWRSVVGLALLDYRRRPTWRWALGPFLIIVAYAWFFGTRREILTPGPAGAELVILFSGAVLLALSVTIAGASILNTWRAPATSEQGLAGGQRVALGQGLEGRLFLPTRGSGPFPGVCLLPDPGAPVLSFQPLAEGLIQQGVAVLLVLWAPAWQRYPDVLRLAPLALEALGRQPLIDNNRLGLVGVDVGGDLALRAATSDRRVRTVVALAPLLEERNAEPGLGLLREMTYPKAIGWRLHGRRRALTRDLSALEAAGQIAPRPVLVLYGSQEPFVSLSRIRPHLERAGVRVETIADEGHRSLPSSPKALSIVSRWLAESLGQENRSGVETER